MLSSALVSSLAGGLFLGSLPLAVAARGGDALQIGLISAALYAWWIVSVPLSVITDKLGIGPTLRMFAPLRFIGLAVIAIGIATEAEWSYGVLLAGALLYGFADVVVDSASGTLPAAVMKSEDYDDAYSSLHAVTRTADLVLGPVLGAGLFLLNLWAPFALAVLLLAVSYGTLFSFFGDPRTQAVPADGMEQGWFSSTFAGLRHVVRTPLVRGIAITLIGVAAASEVTAVVVAPYVRAGAESAYWPQILGGTNAIAGIAAIIAALAATAIAGRLGRTRTMIGAATLGVASPVLMSIGPSWTFVGLALVAAAVGEAIWVPLAQASMMKATPRHLLSRTRAAVMFIIWGTIPATSLIAGALAVTIGLVWTLIATALFAALLCAFGFPALLSGGREEC